MLLTLGLAFVGLLGIWFSVPVWLPWAARPLARLLDARFARYQREGYARFSLDGFTYTNRSVRLKAQRIECLTPAVWLMRLATGEGKKQPPFLSAGGWQLEVAPSAGPAKPVYSQVQHLTADVRFLQRWVPQLVLSNGTIRAEQQSVHIPALTWSSGRLWARIEAEGLAGTVAADVRHAPDCQLQFNSKSLHLESSVQLSTNAAGLSVQSTNRWWDNPVELHARFGRTASLPEEARLEAREFQFPARLVQLPGYREVRGSATARWRQGRFDVDLSAGAHPLAARTNLPPLRLELHARGNTNRAVIDTAVLSSPWLRAALSRELTIHYAGGLLREPARLTLTADLSRQPWFPLEGRLKGKADFSPGVGRFPTADFQLSGAGVGTPELKAAAFSIEGKFDWPALTISNSTATLADGSTASVSGDVALPQRRVESGKFAFSGPLGRRWLPAGYSYQGLTVAGEFHGAFTNLSHRGHLVVTNLLSPVLRPLDLALDWEGRQEQLSEARAELSAGGSLLQAKGAVGIKDRGGELRLDALTLRQAGQPVLSLTEPGRVAFRGLHWTVGSLHWVGAGGELKAQGNVDWPRSGNLEISAQGLHAGLVQDFLKAEVPAVELGALDLTAGWSNGPVKFGLQVSATESNAPPPQGAAVSTRRWASGLRLGVKATLAGDAKGLSVQSLEITSKASPWATIHGYLPLTLNPVAADRWFRIEPEGRVSLTGTFQAEGLLPDKLSAWTGLGWRSPRLDLKVSGTAKEPEGQVQLQLQQIQFPQSKQPVPALTDLRLDLRLDRRRARLADGRLLVEGQQVVLTGEVPLGEGFWGELQNTRLPDWRQASAHLQVAHAEVSAFADLYPKLLSPQGDLEVDVSLLPGFKLDGYLKLQGARTRPLPTVGPVRDIGIDVRCREHLLTVQSATANAGGATVRLSGQADLGETDWFAAVSGAGAKRRSTGLKPSSTPPAKVSAYELLPPFSFHLSGTNVAFMRQAEAIIRGDLDLTAARTNGAPPLIGGAVHLHDSVFLSDLRALIPGNVEVPDQRPPYFSITNALLADWRLAVKVTGDRFLKVRTTLFNGEISADLKLEGSLGTPRALGDVRIDSGIVRFPFGGLQVQQGLVALTSQNPYHPQLSVTAISTQFGYDIRMQVSGTADAPVIQFSSSPPLSSEQILLLLSAGELPQGTFSLTPQQRAQTLGMFLGRDLLSQLGIGDESEQRLTIHSGERIAETGKPTYSIEFKLTDTLSLVGEYDRFGDYNAGVKWRIYSK